MNYTSQTAWLTAMKSAFSDEYVMSLGTSQEHAWKDCYDNLQKYLPLIDDDNNMEMIGIDLKMVQ